VKAALKERTEVAKGTLLVTFDLLGEEVDFRSGQYFFVTLLDPPYDDERGPRRHITVVTSPNQKGVLGLCTRLRDSAFKKSLQELPIGAAVEVEPPKGKFVLPEDSSRPLVLVAGGIGITVFWSMLQYIQEESLPYRITLIYSNRNQAETAFLDDLQRVEQQNADFRLILTMTQDPSWQGETRKIDAQFFRDHLDADLNTYTFMVAGPPPMVQAMQEALAEAGVDEEHVIAEKYSGY
jgi:ferredoxin-NADP reductase